MIASTGETFIGMLGEDQFDHGAADFNDFRVVRDDVHILLNGCAAGPEHFVDAFGLYDADST